MCVNQKCVNLPLKNHISRLQLEDVSVSTPIPNIHNTTHSDIFPDKNIVGELATKRFFDTDCQFNQSIDQFDLIKKILRFR